jgi:threonine aldolase
LAFPDGTADFRSDTVTRPTTEMRRAMAEAEVGDDVYGEDPTVNLLEAEAAAAVGKEAALFVPSGSMGNAIAINLQTTPGDEVICVDSAHVRDYESGAAGALSGVGFRALPAAGGVMDPADIGRVLDAAAWYRPRQTLLVWENTHNASGGTVVPLDVMEAGSAVARDRAAAVHLDGARLWNAVAATGIAAERYAATADTVMFCLSKGLGAPVGSVLCGTAERIAAARRLRKRFGGGMRQAGVIAAAGRVALRDRDRLRHDHDLARSLAETVHARYPDASDPAAVASNMVLVNEAALPFPAEALVDHLAARRILVGYITPGILRFCTHRDVDAADVGRLGEALDEM